MARTKDHEKRASLALAAIEILEREGTSITVGELADKMGVKRPTLLYHFPTYTSIAEEAIKHYLIGAQQHVTKRLANVAHPIDRIYQHALAVAEYQRGKESRFMFLTQVIASSAGPRAPMVAQATAFFFEAHRSSMVKQLEEGIANGWVAPCSPSTIVLLVRAVIDGLMIQRVATKTNTTPVYEFLWDTVLLPLRRDMPATPSATDGDKAAKSGKGAKAGANGRARTNTAKVRGAARAR